MDNKIVRSPRRISRLLFTLTLFLAALGLSFTPYRVANAESCLTDGPTTGAYLVTICISAPADGSSLSGSTTVTATSSVTGAQPSGIQRMVFYLNGQYLLTDVQSPYSFILPTEKWVDGTYSLALEALMRDGFQTGQTQISITLANGITQVLPNQDQYQVKSGTSPPAGQPFTLVATGDGAGGQNDAQQVSDLIATLNPNLFLYLGDVYQKGTYSEFINWYGIAGSLFDRYRAITNPTIGNHEYENGSAPGYFDYWDNVPHYFSFDVSGWHVVNIDSTTQYGQTTSGTPQYEWLANDLMTSTAPCTIVYFHHPPYTVGPQPSSHMFDVWELLASQHVEIALTGHDHNYQRWYPLNGAGVRDDASGVTEFVVGAGGHGVRPFISTDPRLAVGFDSAPGSLGALDLKLYSDHAAFNYVNIDGVTLDSGQISCDSNDLTPPTVPTAVSATATSSTAVALSWQASTDEKTISGYGIYRDDVLIATVTGLTLSYADSGLQAGTSYGYQVDAFDPSGNRSAKSSIATATTPTSLSFTTVADARVESASPNTNYGTSPVLRIDGSPTVNSYFRFDVQGVTGQVVKATIQIFSSTSHGAGYQTRGLIDPGSQWTESTINFGNAPPVGGVVGNSGSFSSGVWVSADVTSLVTGNGAVNIAISTTSSAAAGLASRESGANAPRLIVEYDTTSPLPTPTPTATPTPSPTPIATSTPTPTLTPTPVPTATLTPVVTPTATATATPVASVQVYEALADARVESPNPTTNYGSSTVLRTDGSPEINSYLRFDVQGLNGAVVRATLRIYSSTSHGSGYQVRRLVNPSASWAESTITFANAPAIDSGVVGASPSFAANVWTTVDVTSLVSGNGVVNLAISTTSPSAMGLAARESGATAPQLVVEVQ